MNSQLTLIPHCIIHPERIVLTREIKWSPVRVTPKFKLELTEEEKAAQLAFLNSNRKNNGFLSDHALRKMSKSLSYLLCLSEKKKVYSKLQKKYITFRIVFVTLTLPSTQVHTDKEITNICFNQFLIELNKYHNVKKYIWRAEKQENGNIHYHLLINEFIEYQELRKRWNRIINKLGYVDIYQQRMKLYFRNGFKLSENPNDKRTVEEQRKAYLIGQKSDWRSPNSTDIHDTRKVKSITAYVSKYLKKQPKVNLDESEEENEKMLVKGRLWSCSQNLSNITGCDLIEDWEVSDELEKVAEQSKCKIYKDTYFSVIYVDILEVAKHGSRKLYEYFASYLLETFNFNLQLTTSL